MDNLKVMNQKSSEQHWIDETGNATQYNRLYKHEKLAEKYSAKILKDGLKINRALSEFKAMVTQACAEMQEQYMKDKDLEAIGKGKGNMTWYNFDRSIKMEVAIHDQITFDEKGIELCKQLLNQFLDENIESKDIVIKELVNDAFSTSKGNLDAKKVMNLLRYRTKIKYPLFQKALNELEESIRRPSSKTYFRIWAKDEAGEYQNIDLNFSSIK